VDVICRDAIDRELEGGRKKTEG